MAESLLVDRNFVSAICKLKPNTNQKKIKSTTIIRIFFKLKKEKLKTQKNQKPTKVQSNKNFKNGKERKI